jgi:tetratricopeptide (TPR) repeat protein
MSVFTFRRLVRTGAVALSCVLAHALPASADYEETYRKGILALDGKKWQEAIRLLRQAVDENPLEGGDPIQISGSRSEPYVPLYFIGLAYYRMGDCGRAGITWQMAKMGGEVLDHPALAKAMREHVAACESGAAGGEKSTEAPTPTASAAAAVSPRVQNLLKGAREDLAGKRFARARQRAEDALTLGAAQAEVDALLADVADAETATAGAGRPAAGAEAATSMVAAPPAEAERQAMEAFFALDYGRARRLLEPLAGQAGLSARGHLYLACSIAADAVLSGRDVDAQLQRARAAYQKARTAGVPFDSDWKYISPRLRGLLEGRGPS